MPKRYLTITPEGRYKYQDPTRSLGILPIITASSLTVESMPWSVLTDLSDRAAQNPTFYNKLVGTSKFIDLSAVNPLMDKVRIVVVGVGQDKDTNDNTLGFTFQLCDGLVADYSINDIDISLFLNALDSELQENLAETVQITNGIESHDKLWTPSYRQVFGVRDVTSRDHPNWSTEGEWYNYYQYNNYNSMKRHQTYEYYDNYENGSYYAPWMLRSKDTEDTYASVRANGNYENIGPDTKVMPSFCFSLRRLTA